MQIATGLTGWIWEVLRLCGRFTLRASEIDWGQLLFSHVDREFARRSDQLFKGTPRFNIAPTQNVKCIHHDVQSGGLTTGNYRWGLIPTWADDLRIGARMINARSETLESKPSFKNAFQNRRCLIPMDGYYEWVKRSDGKKQPFLIEPFDGQVKFMAGLWEENRKVVDGSGIRSCTVITTAANSMAAKVHERMPAFICDAQIGVWLDPECHDVALLKNFLRPAKEKAFKLTAVSPHVNSPRNEDERCTEPVDTKSVWETA